MADDTAVLEGVQIIFRNFAGEKRQYNETGKRQFSILLDEELAVRMTADGWNVKMLKRRDPEDPQMYHLPVEARFDRNPPRATVVTSRNRTPLPPDQPELWSILDWLELEACDVNIRGYHWTANGNTGVKAYLKSIFCIMHEDPLDEKYAHLPEVDARGELTGRETQLEIEAGPSHPHYDYEGEIVEETH